MKNYQKGFAPLIIILIIAALAIGGGVYYVKKNKTPAPAVSSNTQATTTATTSDTSTNVNTQTNVKGNTGPDYQPTNKTSGWKTYTNTQYGFSFKYPSTFSVASDSTAGNIILRSKDSVLSIKIETANTLLEQNVKNTVATLKADSAQSAAPVSVSYKATTIGTVNGYLITSQAGDAPMNTDAQFKIQKGNQIFTFMYSYQATPGLFKHAPYDDIQNIISTFN